MTERYNILFFVNCPKGETEGYLRMKVRWDRSVSVTNVGYNVDSDKWDKSLQLCRMNTTHGKNKVSAAEINKEIRRFRDAVDKVFCSLPYGEDMDPEEYKSRLAKELGKAPARSDKGNSEFDAAFTDYMIRQSKLCSWSQNTIDKATSLLHIVKDWKPTARLSDFNQKGLEQFYFYLLESGRKNSTIDKYITNLKSFLKWCGKKKEYSVPEDYKDFSPRIKTIRKTIVWLSWEELLQLYTADLSGMNTRSDNHTDEVRNLFCFSCFTGMRYSDISQLRHSDVQSGVINLPIQKTDEVVVIELNRRAREILDKYKDYDVVSALPQVSNVKCNKIIKRICKHIGLTRSVTDVYYKGSERVEETKPFYKFVSMHTGRRTFICNALEKGISPLVVMKWTGHKDYEEMKPYIDVSDKAKRSAMALFDE